MKKGEIIDFRPTSQVYGTPKNVYTASLFDEVNLIPKEWLETAADQILYPYQLIVADKGFKVKVKQCFFKELII